MSQKQIVRYSALHHIRVGESAFVVPVDHPDESRVSNTHEARTSKVLSYDASTGVFETMNSIYKPAQ